MEKSNLEAISNPSVNLSMEHIYFNCACECGYIESKTQRGLQGSRSSTLFFECPICHNKYERPYKLKVVFEYKTTKLI